MVKVSKIIASLLYERCNLDEQMKRADGESVFPKGGNGEGEKLKMAGEINVPPDFRRKKKFMSKRKSA